MAEITSKIEKLELSNGEKVDLTLNFARMLFLRNNGHEKEVNACMQVINGTKIDMLDMPDFLYGAYLCANKTPQYTKEEFTELIPWDMEECLNLWANLNSKKKVDISKIRSSAKNQKAK